MTTVELNPEHASKTADSLEIALPAPGDRLDQDQEWVLVRNGQGWKKIRLHDYGKVYAVPGLYEKWIYDIFQCRSPEEVRKLLDRSLRQSGTSPDDLTTLDLGAGNGCVAEELRRIGIRRFVGVDICDEARQAAERDRPGLYDGYVIDDLTDLDDDSRRILDRYDFNCLTCVAALGFADIPPNVFAAACNRVANGGWIAFTIKEDFVDTDDESGFAQLIRRMLKNDVLQLVAKERYPHRISTDGQPLMYLAFVGRKLHDIPEDWISR